MIWHYTIAPKLPAIIDTDMLKRSRAHHNECASILWFSFDHQWEPSAAKGNAFGGFYTLKDHRRLLGLCRFGMFPSEAPQETYHFMHMVPDNLTPDYASKLVNSGHEMGADYREWVGCLVDIPLDRVTFQFWNKESEKWDGTLTPSEFSEQWHAFNTHKMVQAYAGEVSNV